MAGVNYNILVKYSVVYVIFILGVAMISEWICSKTGPTNNNNYLAKEALRAYERKLDASLLALKKDYIEKAKAVLHQGPNGQVQVQNGSYQAPNGPIQVVENFSNIQPQVDSDENYILNQASIKLDALRGTQEYPQGVMHPQAFYSVGPRNIVPPNPQKIIIEPKDKYVVGGYEYSAPQSVRGVDPFSNQYTLFK